MKTLPRRRRRWVGLQLARHDYDDDGTTVDILGPVGRRGRCTHCTMPFAHEAHQPAPAPAKPRKRPAEVDEAMRESRRRAGERDEVA